MDKRINDLLAELCAESTKLPGQQMGHTAEELLGHALRNERDEKQQQTYIQHNPDAVRLLATKGFDLIKKSEDIMTLYVDAEVDKSEKFQNRDLQGFISHHHDMIIETSVQETRNWVENDIYLKKLQSEWMNNLWHDISDAAADELKMIEN